MLSESTFIAKHFMKMSITELPIGGKCTPLGMDGKDCYEEAGLHDPLLIKLGSGGMTPSAIKGCAEIMRIGTAAIMVRLC